MGGGSEKTAKSTYILPDHLEEGGLKKFSMLPQLPSSSVAELSTRVPSAVTLPGTEQF